MAKPDEQALRRLSGGRWQTRDERFTIEPQSGTWVVIDGEATDELGLPLVRGPFGSLTAAKEAIAEARRGAPATSPLADALAAAQARAEPAQPAQPATLGRKRRSAGKPTRPEPPPKRGPEPPPKREPEAAPEAAPEAEPADQSPDEPEPGREPAWLGALGRRDRRRADALLERLARAGVDDAAEVARQEIVEEQPALARLAIRRRLTAAVAEAKSPADAAERASRILAAGDDEALEVAWRLVDADGRDIGALEPPD